MIVLSIALTCKSSLASSIRLRLPSPGISSYSYSVKTVLVLVLDSREPSDTLSVRWIKRVSVGTVTCPAFKYEYRFTEYEYRSTEYH